LNDSTNNIEKISKNFQPLIQQGDALAIKVTTLDPQSNILYNSGSIPLNGIGSTNTQAGLPTGASNTATLSEGYVVDNNGDINFPVQGKINLQGLTIEQAQGKLTDLISRTDKGVIVNIRIQNYKVTVIGEVAKPGTFTIPDDKVTLLEALGLAGDMTPLAVRKNVLIIREENGVRTRNYINLNDKDVFNSPFFYLKQNDVVYVQPDNKLKNSQTDTRYIRLIPIITATISALAVVLTRIL